MCFCACKCPLLVRACSSYLSVLVVFIRFKTNKINFFGGCEIYIFCSVDFFIAKIKDVILLCKKLYFIAYVLLTRSCVCRVGTSYKLAAVIKRVKALSIKILFFY